MHDTTIETDDGTVIDVAIRGAGPDLVLLHGWTAAAADWQAHRALLSLP
jgi:pimeloyl-ACP methyl ester carboxylesterase